MEKYKYTALNKDRKRVTGFAYADSENELRGDLQLKGLFVVTCRTVKRTDQRVRLPVSKVGMGEFALFCRQLSVMLGSGVRVDSCLETLSARSFSRGLSSVLRCVHGDVLSGMPLHQAFARHPHIFRQYFVKMVKIGTEAGDLSAVLENCACYYENEDKIKKKLSSALAYPAFLLLLLGVVCFCIVGFVIPTFQETVQALGIKELPALTLAVFGIGDFLRENALLIFALLIVLFAGARIFAITPAGRMFFDTLKLKLPLIKSVNTNLVTSRFSRSVCLLLSNGTDMVEAFESSAQIVENEYARKRILGSVDDLKRGKSAVRALAGTEIFPDMFIQMVAVGEKSGSLEAVLHNCTGYFESRSEASINRMLSALQPAMLIIIGGITALVFAAVYMPITGVMGTLS